MHLGKSQYITQITIYINVNLKRVAIILLHRQTKGNN